MESAQDQQMTRKAVRSSLVLVFGVFGAVGPVALKRVILVYNQEKDQKVWWRVQVEFAQDQQMTRKAVRSNLVLVFGVFGAVGPVALKRVILVYNQEKDQKVWWRVQEEFVQDLAVIIKFVN